MIVAVDTVIFAIGESSDLCVLLIKRDRDPFNGSWALPGVILSDSEELQQAAQRTISTKLGISGEIYLEQLCTFDKPDRDPRDRVLSVGYYALLRERPVPSGDNLLWASIDSMEQFQINLAFDHDQILDTALRRIRGKIEYFPKLAEGLVAREFTIAELRQAYEVVQGTKLDDGNFRKKFKRLVADGIVEKLDATKATSGKPATLYRFK